MAETRIFTSESVSEGHPDKVCDRISDAVLDAMRLHAIETAHYVQIKCPLLTAERIGVARAAWTMASRLILCVGNCSPPCAVFGFLPDSVLEIPPVFGGLARNGREPVFQMPVKSHAVGAIPPVACTRFSGSCSGWIAHARQSLKFWPS